ncbi:MAG: hypothetical protein ABR591_04670 [Candidatus Velthaea sp.]
MSLRLASVSAFVAACDRARSLDLAAYTLRPGAVCAALVRAAERGAQVRVRLERDPLDDRSGSLHAANAAAVAALRAAGADAALTVPGEPVLHMKAAVADGVAWFDDRNWAGSARETVLRDDDRADVAAVAAALAGRPGATGRLRTDKAGAQALEAAVIRNAGAAPLSVESESFGTGAVYSALLRRAKAGRPTRLLVARREASERGRHGVTERRRLGRLQALGVDVRTGNVRAPDVDEKLAVAGVAAWAGSANATYARGGAGRQRDWGITTHDPALLRGLARAFETNWRAAIPFRRDTTTSHGCVL